MDETFQLRNDPPKAARKKAPTPKKPKPEPNHRLQQLRQLQAAHRQDKRTPNETRFIPEIIPATPIELNFRHGHWWQKREKIRQHLADAGASPFALHRWDCCGSNARTEWSETLQKRRIRANYCHNRHCEPCMRAKANRIAANLKKKLTGRPDGRYRFITLTLLHRDEPLKQQIARIYRCFKKLRQGKLWKKAQAGGAFMLEVKHNGKHWHPHLHIVHEGKWINARELSEAWHDVTGDSHIVDVRAIGNEQDAAHYVTKYITKSTSASVWENNDLAQEWIISTRGVRTCGTIGRWRGFKLNQPVAVATDWQPEASLDALVQRARAGEEHAAIIIADLRPPGDFDAHIPQ